MLNSLLQFCEITRKLYNERQNKNDVFLFKERFNVVVNNISEMRLGRP